MTDKYLLIAEIKRKIGCELNQIFIDEESEDSWNEGLADGLRLALNIIDDVVEQMKNERSDS